MDKYDGLKLKNQLCFPLYSVSNLITRNYQPLLESLDLTYTQYIVMMGKGGDHRERPWKGLVPQIEHLDPFVKEAQGQGLC